jgi:hypothetical protein
MQEETIIQWICAWLQDNRFILFYNSFYITIELFLINISGIKKILSEKIQAHQSEYTRTPAKYNINM